MIVPGIKIGVLGGIGPESTAEFYKKLIYRLQQKKFINSNEDYPQIIINSIPAPELINEYIDDLLPYINGLKELENFNIDFIVMVCNTIHLFYERLQKEIKTEILDLRKAVKNYIIKNKIKKYLILGTPLTIKRGLYRFKGFEIFEPNKEEIRLIKDAIFNFNIGLDKDRDVVINICNKYFEKGAETVILGCTELAVMIKDIPHINTIDILVEEILEVIRNANKNK